MDTCSPVDNSTSNSVDQPGLGSQPIREINESIRFMTIADTTRHFMTFIPQPADALSNSIHQFGGSDCRHQLHDQPRHCLSLLLIYPSYLQVLPDCFHTGFSHTSFGRVLFWLAITIRY